MWKKGTLHPEVTQSWLFFDREQLPILKSAYSFVCHLLVVNLRKVENLEKAFSLTKQTTSMTNLSVTFLSLSQLVLRRFLSKKQCENLTFVLPFFKILQISSFRNFLSYLLPV